MWGIHKLGRRTLTWRHHKSFVSTVSSSTYCKSSFINYFNYRYAQIFRSSRGTTGSWYNTMKLLIFYPFGPTRGGQFIWQVSNTQGKGKIWQDKSQVNVHSLPRVLSISSTYDVCTVVMEVAQLSPLEATWIEPWHVYDQWTNCWQRLQDTCFSSQCPFNPSWHCDSGAKPQVEQM